MNFGAVDIGSNAVRLLIAHVMDKTEGNSIKKVAFLRAPVRLGEDVFSKGRISESKKKTLAGTLTAFRSLLEVYNVVDYRICATSAMRDARNRKEVVAFAEGKSDLCIEVIDGGTEAALIFSTFTAHHLDRSENYLYIDVGGGSTELTLIRKGKPIQSKSFDVGTLRMLNQSVKDNVWNDMNKWIQEIDDSLKPLTAIGTGGNINKIVKMAGHPATKTMSLQALNEHHRLLDSFSMEERINRFGLRADRADVIVPAAYLYSSIMRKAGIDSIYVPKAGLSDGIVYELWRKYKLKTVSGFSTDLSKE